jgi:hypothetical protein
MNQVTTWDGNTFALEDQDVADARRSRGEVQVFDGKEYQPGGVMKYAGEFPFAVEAPKPSTKKPKPEAAA